MGGSRFLFTTAMAILFTSQILVAKSISVMQYNVENLFDTVDDPDKQDEDFTPDGRYQWNEDKLQQKMINLAAIVTSVKNEDGSVCPDVLALGEIENAAVLKAWKAGPLKACGYSKIIIDKNDGDSRGIRVATMTRLALAGAPRSHKVYEGGRFIQEVPLHIDGHVFVIFANHWKSRIVSPNDPDGGIEKRRKAANVLHKRMQEIFDLNAQADLMAIGDFNDESEDSSLRRSLRVSHNLETVINNDSTMYLWESSYDLFAQPPLSNGSVGDEFFKKARGTYYYSRERAFFQLDHILLSRGLFDGRGLTFIPRSFAVVRHKDFTDSRGIPIRFDKMKEAPQRGASDHFPILARFHVEERE